MIENKIKVSTYVLKPFNKSVSSFLQSLVATPYNNNLSTIYSCNMFVEASESFFS